jgi:hypothetical protein
VVPLLRLALGVLVIGAACARPEPADDMEPAMADTVSDTGLATSLEVGVRDSAIDLTLHVTNVSQGPLVLEFSSAQEFDFVVEQGGTEVWRWAADRGFAQMLRSDTLAADDSRAYRATWENGGRSGEFEVVGRLTSMNRPVELRTRVDVPGG